MQTNYLNKFIGALSLFIIFGLSGLSLNYASALSNKVKSAEVDLSEPISDAINPYCKGVDYSVVESSKYYDTEFISIEIDDKMGWYSNIFEIITGNDRVIDSQYKERFNAQITVVFKSNFSCVFEGEIRISGDWTDHINRNDATTSLDVKLLTGNIGGITKFKLFKPVSRHYDNEIFVSTLLEKIGFLSPRTTNVIVKMRDYNNEVIESKYIFQEKFSKELIEYFGYREGPLLETDETHRWSKIVNNNGIEEKNKKYFMPGKVLNKYWSRKSVNNKIITIEALEKYNKSIFTSNQPWTQLNYKHLGSNEVMLYKFDAALIALDSNHSITNHQRKFYFNKLEDQFYPIYYDGATMFMWGSRDLRIRNDYENYESLSKASKKLHEEIQINNEDLFNELIMKGVGITEEQVNKLVKRFKSNLEVLGSIDKADQQDELNKFKNKEFINTFNLPEGELKIVFHDINLNQNLECDVYLTNCKTKKFNSTDNDLFQLHKSTTEKKYFLFGASLDTFLEEKTENERFEQTLDEGVKFRTFSDVKFEINFQEKVANFNLNLPDSKVFIYGEGLLKDWSINIIGSKNNEMLQERVDQNLLTGCLTMYDLQVSNLKLEINNSNCEDAINIINSKGSIHEIKINGSKSDAVDFDFSDLTINTLEIFDSANDCIDLSSGKYIIYKLLVNNCKDKGVSIGEKSTVEISNAKISNTNIGVAVKDSSYLYLNNSEINSSNYCYAAYRKKQEFGPSAISINSLKCSENFESYIQKGSVLINNEK